MNNVVQNMVRVLASFKKLIPNPEMSLRMRTMYKKKDVFTAPFLICKNISTLAIKETIVKLIQRKFELEFYRIPDFCFFEKKYSSY